MSSSTSDNHFFWNTTQSSTYTIGSYWVSRHISLSHHGENLLEAPWILSRPDLHAEMLTWNQLVVSQDPKQKNHQGTYTEPINYWGVHLPVINSPHLHFTMCTEPCFVLIDSSVWKMFTFKQPDNKYYLWIRWHFRTGNDRPMIPSLMVLNFFDHGLNEVSFVWLLEHLLESIAIIGISSSH